MHCKFLKGYASSRRLSRLASCPRHVFTQVSMGAAAERIETKLYADLLRDRRVCIVGAADTTKGSGRGALIDGYDLVVRINSQWPVRPVLMSDIGERADILYHCCNTHSPIAKLRVPEFANLKFAWYETNVETDLLVELCRQHGVPCAPFDPLRQALTADLGSVPNTGTIAITQMLATDLKELHVTGFSFLFDALLRRLRGKGRKVQILVAQAPRKHRHACVRTAAPLFPRPRQSGQPSYGRSAA